MRYSAEHKDMTLKKILDAAARRFRAEGYNGLGIDGLAKAAGVTNGAFYGHFESKAAAFREVSILGLVDLREGIERYREQVGDKWLGEFARFYLSAAKLDFAENACALPSFAPEMARAPEATRAAFEAELLKVVQAVADGLPGEDSTARTARAWAILSALVGGVTLARSLENARARQGLVSAVESSVAALAN